MPIVLSATRLAAFADVPDPRRAASVTDPQAAILTLAGSAILANPLSVLAETLTRWFAPRAVPHRTGAFPGVAIDGRAKRGRLWFPDDGGPVHALPACCHEQGIVLAHEPITRPPTRRGPR